MKRFGTPTYLFAGFFFIAALVMSESVLDLFHAQENRQYVEAVIHTHNSKIRALHELQESARQRIQLINTLLIVDDPVKGQELTSRLGELNQQLLEHFYSLAEKSQDKKEQPYLRELESLIAAEVPIVRNTGELIKRGQRERSRQLMQEQLIPLQERFAAQTAMLHEYYMAWLGKHAAEAQEADESWRRYVVVFGLAMLMLTLIIAKIVIRRIDDDRKALLQAQDSLEGAVSERTAELEHIAEQLKQAQRVARLGHWEWDIPSGGLKWSDEIYRIFGVSPGQYEPSYEAFLGAVHPEDRNIVTGAVERAVNGEERYSVEHRVVWPDGSVRIVHEQGEVHCNEDGSALSMLGTVQDITDRKESEKRQLLAASVYHNTGDGVMITDAENNIVEVNEAFSEILGYRIEELVGRNPRLLQSGRHDQAFFQALWHSLNKTGQWQGEIWDRRKQGDILPLWMTINVVRDKQGSLNNYVALFRDISKVKENEQSLWQLAHHDPLTGLANRSLMYARLQLAMAQADREEGGVALLLIDLDGFKRVNDTLGHSAGDELLIHVAEILKCKVRESDTVVRYAGDEFVILLKGLHDRAAIHRIANDIVETLASPVPVREGEAHIGASIGIAIYPTHAYESESLIAKADQAMYRAKKLGKGQVCFFGDW